MYHVSTQKRFWTFESPSELDNIRVAVNQKHVMRYKQIVEGESGDIVQNEFLTAKEEAIICRIFTETGIRFGDEFKPDMWPSVRWIAFAYFKRFYLKESVMEYSPKNVMIACYYLASKVDEFNISIDNFVDNLRSGSRESNIETVLSLEPIIMLKLEYQLTVHAPFRPLEGHLIEIKAKMAKRIEELNLDLELVRPHCNDYFKLCLYGDVMFLYPPSQIALSAIKYGLEKMVGELKASEFIRDFLISFIHFDFVKADNLTEIARMERLQIRLDHICGVVLEQASQTVDSEEATLLQKKFFVCMQKANELQPKLKQIEKEQQQNQGNAFDSDDDF